VTLSTSAVIEKIHSENDTSMYRILLEMAGAAGFVYPMSLLTLFCLLCSMASSQLRLVSKIIRNKIPSDGMDQLKELQNEHARISASIHLIDRSFGPIFVLGVTCIFVSVTIGFVYVMVTTLSDPSDWALYCVSLSIIFFNFFNLILVCFCADNIKNKVYSNFINALFHHIFSMDIRKE